VHDTYIDANLLEGIIRVSWYDSSETPNKIILNTYMDIQTTRRGQEIPRREGSTQVKLINGEDVAIRRNDWREGITRKKEMGMWSSSALWMSERRDIRSSWYSEFIAKNFSSGICEIPLCIGWGLPHNSLKCNVAVGGKNSLTLNTFGLKSSAAEWDMLLLLRSDLL